MIPEKRLLKICEKVEQYMLEVKQLRLLLLEGDFCQQSHSNNVILLKLHAMIVDPLAAMKHTGKSPVQRECVDGVMNGAAAGNKFSTYQVSRTQLTDFYTSHNPRKLQSVNKIVSDYSTPEIIANLRRKYGHAAVSSLYEMEDETALLPDAPRINASEIFTASGVTERADTGGGKEQEQKGGRAEVPSHARQAEVPTRPCAFSPSRRAWHPRAHGEVEHVKKMQTHLPKQQGPAGMVEGGVLLGEEALAKASAGVSHLLPYQMDYKLRPMRAQLAAAEEDIQHAISSGMDEMATELEEPLRILRAMLAEHQGREAMHRAMDAFFEDNQLEQKGSNVLDEGELAKLVEYCLGGFGTGVELSARQAAVLYLAVENSLSSSDMAAERACVCAFSLLRLVARRPESLRAVLMHAAAGVLDAGR
jgi:hypothetical protein